MTSRRTLAATAIAVVVLALSACSLFPTPQPTPTPTATPTGDGVLVIGDLAPLSGPLVGTSLAQMAAVELAAREITEQGGFNDKPVQVFHRNAGDGDAATTAASVAALLAKNVDVIIVPAIAAVAAQVMQETAGKNVAVVSIASADNAPAGAPTTPAEVDAEFQARLASSDPVFTDPAFAMFQYSAESYSLTIATGLAAHVMSDDGGSSLTEGLLRVTGSAGIACTTYGMCLDVLTTQPAINYIGLAGQINYDPASGIVFFGTLSTDAPSSTATPTAKN